MILLLLLLRRCFHGNQTLKTKPAAPAEHKCTSYLQHRLSVVQCCVVNSIFRQGKYAILRRKSKLWVRMFAYSSRIDTPISPKFSHTSLQFKNRFQKNQTPKKVSWVRIPVMLVAVARKQSMIEERRRVQSTFFSARSQKRRLKTRKMFRVRTPEKMMESGIFSWHSMMRIEW
jgi:hypothetical protein